MTDIMQIIKTSFQITIINIYHNWKEKHKHEDKWKTSYTKSVTYTYIYIYI